MGLVIHVNIGWFTLEHTRIVTLLTTPVIRSLILIASYRSPTCFLLSPHHCRHFHPDFSSRKILILPKESCQRGALPCERELYLLLQCRSEYIYTTCKFG